LKYVIATDHAGIETKNFTKELLLSLGHEVIDLGPDSTDRVDYPDFAEKLSRKVLEEAGEFNLKADWRETGVFGILICGTGIGMSITANKIRGIRASLCHDAYTSEMGRAHNNSNILCFGARTTGFGTIESIVKIWDKTDFEGGRHLNRVLKIEAVNK
jgi:ribose 5-phosphate isomerase B